MRDFKAQIEWRNPRDLIPHVNNAVVHSPAQVDGIAGQIAAFGFDQPIVIDHKNIILKGHGRREAAIKLNMNEVPVIVQDLDEYQAMAARIADNKVPSREFKTDMLKFELGTLNRVGFDLNLTAIKPLELKSLVPSDNQSKQIIGESPAEYSESDDSDMEPGPVNHVEPPAESESGGYFMDRNPVIQYNIVFDDKEQQEVWHSFVASLKEKYPDIDTIAARLMKFISDADNAS